MENRNGKTKQELQDEFNALRNDDNQFAKQYGANEFSGWLKDYDIKPAKSKTKIALVYILATLTLTLCANAKDVKFADGWGKTHNITIIRGIEKQGDSVIPTFCLIKKEGKKRAFVFATDNLNGKITHERYTLLLKQTAGISAGDNWRDNKNKIVSLENGKIVRTSRNSDNVSTFTKTADTFNILSKKITEKVVMAEFVKKEKESKKRIAFLTEKAKMLNARLEEKNNVWELK